MSVTLSTAIADALADTAAGFAEGGTPPALLRFYGGARPAGPGAATAETLLAEVTLAAPAFTAATGGAATLTDPGAVTGLADGTATWARLVTGGTAAGAAGLIDFKVTGTGGGGDLQLNTTAVATGVNFDIAAGGTITMPAGVAD